MIVVYTSSNCPYCKKVKDYLRLRGHKFIEINVSISKTGAQHLIGLGINAVPVTEGENWRIIGYNINELDTRLRNINV